MNDVYDEDNLFLDGDYLFDIKKVLFLNVWVFSCQVLFLNVQTCKVCWEYT